MKQVPANTNNYMVGRNGKSITKVIVHWIVGTLESCDATFKNPARLASAHYGIGDDEIHQYVKEEDTAYHAGNWDVNLESIGIEHEGGPDIPITDATYATSAKLIKEICQRYNIPLDRQHILKHKEVSLNPTACPGNLDVDRLIKEASSASNAPQPQRPVLPVYLSTLLQENNLSLSNEGQIRDFFQKAIDFDGVKRDLENTKEELDIDETVINKLRDKLVNSEDDLTRCKIQLADALKTGDILSSQHTTKLALFKELIRRILDNE